MAEPATIEFVDQTQRRRKLQLHDVDGQLRVNLTSALANSGVIPELRMKLTGHKTESVHRGYTHHELDTLRAAIEKLPGLK